MSTAFNLTAQLNLRGPANIRNIVAGIRRELGTINADINVRINPSTSRNLTQVTGALNNFNTALRHTQMSAAHATDAINRFSNALRGMGNINQAVTGMNHAAQATRQLTANVTQAQRQVQQTRTEFEEFGRQGALAIRRFAAFSVVTGTIMSFTNALSKGISEFIAFDKEFVRLQQVTGESAEGLKALRSQITQLATGYGVASKELTIVSSTLAQAGLSARDTEKALKALALSSLAPSFDDMNQTVEGSIALMRQFSISAGGLEDALGAINAVAAKFAVESSDIITAIQRTGGVFAAASKGVSEGKDALNEFIAVFTSVRATTRESAETIATGLRTIFTRIQRGGTISALKQFGVDLTDAQGKFVGAYKAVELLSQGLSKLDPRDLKFSQIVEELGGFRQIGKVIPLIQQFATAQDALKVAQQGQGSLAKDAITAQKSLANQFAKVREEFLSLVRSIGESESFKTFISLSLNLASALIKVADSLKIVLPSLTAMVAIRGSRALLQFGTGFVGGLRSRANSRANGGFIGLNSGGLVPGTGDRDTVPAMLTAGEFVIRKKAVQAIGANKLHNINKYAVGGPIKASDLPSAAIRKRVKKASSKEAKEHPELFRKGYYLTDSDEIKFTKKEYGVKASSNISADAFEKKVEQISRGKRASSSIAPVDVLKSKLGNLEVRNRIRSTSDKVLLDKFLRLRLAENKPLIRNTTGTDHLTFRDPVSVVYNTGKLKRSRFKELKHDGGIIRAFEDAGSVSAIGGKPASRSQIIKALGIDGVARAGGITANEVYKILGLRNPDAKEKSIQEAIQKEYIKKINRKSGAMKAQNTKLASRGLLFGAAGMFGSAFAPIKKTISSDLLKGPVNVSIMSGIMQPDVASSVENAFVSSINKTSNKVAKKIMVADILEKAGLGRELNLDFDRTLAFGADKILSDPRTPKFAEFSDRNKVSQALAGSKLSLLGKELVGLVSKKPELLNNMRIITARPKSTLDLIHSWLSKQGLPIPLSQFKGLGGTGVSGSQIAKLKASLLSPGSLFVDDDKRNIKAAKARSKEGIESYRYGNRKSKTNINGDATAQGIIFEKVIEKLGGPLALKGKGLDFPQGLKGAAKYFRIPGNIPTDAKRTISGPSTIEDNIITYLKANGYASGGLITKLASGGLAKSSKLPAVNKIGAQIADKYKLVQGKTTAFNQLENNCLSIANEVATRFGYESDPEKIRKQLEIFQQLRAGKNSAVGLKPSEETLKKSSSLRRLFNNPTKAASSGNIIIRESDELMRHVSFEHKNKEYNFGAAGSSWPIVLRIPLKKKEEKFGRGGSPEDTVPALLTPGEFVINKKAASRIGSAKLHQLNRADKIQGYNKGGVVQRFVDGGGVGNVLTQLNIGDIKTRALVEQAYAKNAAAVNDLTDKILQSNLSTQETKAALTAFSKAINSGADQTTALARSEQAVSAQRNKSSSFAPESNLAKEAHNDALTQAKQDKMGGYAESRDAGSVGKVKYSLSGDLVVKADNYLRGFGQSTQDTDKALLVWKTTLKQTGSKTLALEKAMDSLAKSAQDEAEARKQAAKSARAQIASGGGGGGGSGGGGGDDSGGGMLGSIMDMVGMGGKKGGGRSLIRQKGMLGKLARGGARLGKSLTSGPLGFALQMTAGLGLDSLANAYGGEKTTAGRNISNIGGGMLNMGGTGAMIGSMIMPGIGTVIGGGIGAGIGYFSGKQGAKQAHQAAADAELQRKTGIAQERSQASFGKYQESVSSGLTSGTEFNNARNEAISAIGSAAMTSAGSRGTSDLPATGLYKQAEKASYFGKMLGYTDQDKGEHIKNIAKDNAGVADQAKSFLTSEMQRTGQTLQQLSKSMNPSQYEQLLQAMAQADESYIANEQGRAAELERHKGDLAAQAAINKSYDEQGNKIKQNVAQKLTKQQEAINKTIQEQKKYDAALRKMTMSFTTMFKTLGEVNGKQSYDLNKKSSRREDILHGRATVSNGIEDNINVLENPSAYSQSQKDAALKQAGGFLGPAGNAAIGLSQAYDKTKNAANIALQNTNGNLSAQKDAAKTAIGQQILSSMGNTSEAQTLIRGIQEKIEKGTDEESIQQIIEDSLKPLEHMSQEASKALIEGSKLAASKLKELAETSKAVADIDRKLIEYRAKEASMKAETSLNMKEALGIKVTPADKMKTRLADSAVKLGMRPEDINAQSLMNRRAGLMNQQKSYSAIAGATTQGSEISSTQGQTYANTTRALANLDDAIATTEEELKRLPDTLQSGINDLIGEMKDRVSHLEQIKEARAGFAEKLVTSTPKEIMSLKEDYALLGNALKGNVNTINQSRSAQKAYFQALRSGQGPQKAQQAAQAAFANQNKKTLSTLKEYSELTGVKGPELDKMKANVIEGMARGNGTINEPMIQNALKQLRQSPEERAASDPVLVELKKQVETLQKAQTEAFAAAAAVERDKQAKLLEEVSKPIIDSFNSINATIKESLARIAGSTGQEIPGTTTPIPQQTAQNQNGGAQQPMPGSVIGPFGAPGAPIVVPPQTTGVAPPTSLGGQSGLQPVNYSGFPGLQGLTSPRPPQPQNGTTLAPVNTQAQVGGVTSQPSRPLYGPAYRGETPERQAYREGRSVAEVRQGRRQVYEDSRTARRNAYEARRSGGYPQTDAFGVVTGGQATTASSSQSGAYASSPRPAVNSIPQSSAGGTGGGMAITISPQAIQVLQQFNTNLSKTLQQVKIAVDPAALTALQTFSSSMSTIAQQLASLNIPPEIKITATHEVNINLANGAGLLAVIDEKIAKAVVDEVGAKLGEINKNNEGQLGNTKPKPIGAG
jgi:hypothetical protein